MAVKPIADFRLSKPLGSLSHPREAIRQFTPNWFAATMGTGILAIALALVSKNWPALFAIGEMAWIGNIVLFCLFSGLYAARWLLFTHEAKRVFGHSTVSMFFGTIPMGLATLINGALIFGIPRWGAATMVPVAEGLWWFDAALSLACGVLIPYLMFTRQEHRIDQMTAVWLLPVVAAEVAASSGALLAPHLVATDARFLVLIASYALWAYSVPVALSILVLLILRLALHKLPHENMAASAWLALGPIGTAALGMLLLGADAPGIFAAHGLAKVGEVAQGIGAIAGILFWGLGLWWMVLALLITARYFKGSVPFNLGWWGFTFPLGVYAVATLRLGETLRMSFFSTFGSILVAGLVALWLVVAARTCVGAYRGELFVSPCIATRSD